jgi:hypothetical protein
MNPKKRKLYSLGYGATCPTGYTQVGDTYCFQTDDPTINKDVYEIAPPTEPDPKESYWNLKKSILDAKGLTWDMDASVPVYTHVKPPYKTWVVDPGSLTNRQPTGKYMSVGWLYTGSNLNPEWFGAGYAPCWDFAWADWQAYIYNEQTYDDCPSTPNLMTDYWNWPQFIPAFFADNYSAYYNPEGNFQSPTFPSLDITTKGTNYAGPIQMKGCSPYPASATAENPLCPGIKPPTPACFAPFDKISIGLSAMYSLGLSYFFYRDNLESVIPTAALTSAVDNALRYFSADLTPIIGSPEYAEYSAPIFSGALGALAVTTTSSVDSDFKLFLIGAMTNYLTNITAITVENYQCPKPPSS